MQKNNLFKTIGFGLLILLFSGGILLWQLFRTRSKLRANNIELQNVNATKDKFFGLIAHDIRNPVVALSGVGEQLKYYLENDRPDKLQRLTNRIEGTAGRLSNLLDDLLQWAFLQTGTIPYQPEKINLYKIADDNFQLYQEMANMKNITLANKIPPDLMAFADPRAISTVVRNLLNNAIKFSNPGGAIEVSGDLINDKINIAIKDSGKGMTPEELSKLFSLNNKSKKGTAGEKGNGLGLILCRELIQLNKGTITANSELNKGSQFQFSLPLNN